MEKENKVIEQIKDLWQYLSESSKTELQQILMFWEKYKKEWERLKDEFWKNHKREDLDVLLWNYKANRSKFMEQLDSNEKQMIRSLGWSLFERFMEEYLRTFIFYNGWVDIKGKKADCIKYEYEDFQAWNLFMDEWKYILLDFSSKNLGVEWIKPLIKNIKLTEWSYLKLDHNSLFGEWAEFLAKNIQLKEWMSLILDHNEIWAEWAEAISHIELKEWVKLNLRENRIWAEWAKVIAENMELKEWVILDLRTNKIWDEWAKALIDNIELKEWVKLDLGNNNISDVMKTNLKKWEKSYEEKWVHCEVLVD